MDNPKFEHDDGKRQNSAVNDPNSRHSTTTQFKCDITTNNDIVLTVDDVKSTQPARGRETISTCCDVRGCIGTQTNFFIKKLFITQWISAYSAKDLVGDLLAGITIGLTVIPQSMALAGIAGVPAQYGLYSSFVGAFIYALLGTSKVVPMGPTAIVSLLTHNTIGIQGPVYASLLCFFTGVVQLGMSFTGLGFLVNFISVPVCSGFMSASAILIIVAQVKDLIGVDGGGGNLLKMCNAILSQIGDISVGDTVMGLLCIGIVVILKAFSNTRIGPVEKELQTSMHKNVNKLIWAIGAFRNSFVVILCSFISFWYVHQTNHDITSENPPPIPFKVIGKIPNGLPSFELPKFSYDDVNLYDIILFMGFGVVVVPLISSLENMSLCKMFADGQPVDIDQELLAIGFANVGNSLFQGFPGSGAIARGALNYSSGVRTPLGNLYTGLSVVAALIFLTPYFYYIPKASLAAVITAASFMIIDFEMVRSIYKSKKRDLILMVLTFFACVFLSLECGVLLGIVANIGFILCSAAKPVISIQVQKNYDGITYLLLTPDRYLIFPSMEYVRQTITERGLCLGIPIVIDGSRIFQADFTTANVFSMMSRDFSKKGQYIYLYNLKPSVFKVFKGLKNCNIFLCADKDELDKLLKNHLEVIQDQERIWTTDIELKSRDL